MSKPTVAIHSLKDFNVSKQDCDHCYNARLQLYYSNQAIDDVVKKHHQIEKEFKDGYINLKYTISPVSSLSTIKDTENFKGLDMPANLTCVQHLLEMPRNSKGILMIAESFNPFHSDHNFSRDAHWLK